MNDSLVWLIAAVLIGVAALVWVRSASARKADPIEPPAAPETVLREAPAPEPSRDGGDLDEAASLAGLTAIGVPAAAGPPDDLSLLKGVGPKLVLLLTGLGITRFDQIAAWTSADIAAVDAHLGNFRGRIERDHWIEQAGLLARGEIAAFEAKFGKLDRPPQ